jgi:hypothetical protein
MKPLLVTGVTIKKLEYLNDGEGNRLPCSIVKIIGVQQGDDEAMTTEYVLLADQLESLVSSLAQALETIQNIPPSGMSH